MLLCIGQRGSTECIGQRVSVASSVGCENQRNRKCCCVSDSQGVLSVSDSEGVLSVSDSEGVLSVLNSV